MEKKTASAIMLTLLLTSMLTLAFNIQPARAEPRTIIVPDNYPTIQKAVDAARSGDTVYVKAGTYHENVGIQKSGLRLIGENRDTTIIDGGGHGTVVFVWANNTVVTGFTIRNSGINVPVFDSGILIWYGLHNVSVFNNNVDNNRYGIALEDSSNVSLFNNTVTNSLVYGMILMKSRFCFLRNNIMAGNRFNFGVWGESDTLQDYVHDIDASNLVNGKPVYYMLNQTGLTLTPSTYPNMGYLALINSTNITVEDFTLTNNVEGILVAYTTNSAIKNNNINGNDMGIWLQSSYNVSLSNNTVINNRYGIILANSFQTALRSNLMAFNDYNFAVDGSELSHFTQFIDTSNTVDQKPIYYWINRRNKGVPSDAGFVALVNCANITVKDLELRNNGQDIILAYTTNSVVTNNRVTNTGSGIFLLSSSYNTVSTNNVTFNGYGISLYGSSNNNNIIENNIANNAFGIESLESSFNSLSSNNITNNSWSGISFYHSSKNAIYHNNFVNNERQASISQSYDNVWDDGYPSGGNYWSDYTGIDGNGDGIGDTPYTIDVNNIDHYPLVTPWTPIPPNQPPNCVVRLQKDGFEITEIGVEQFFDIYVGASSDDTGIMQVRFTSNDIRDSPPTGSWTEWYEWDTSSGDWNALEKTMAWAFSTPGYKEAWAEIRDNALQTDRSCADIYVPGSQPPICNIRLRRSGTQITEVDQGKPIEIYVGDSTDDAAIATVMFSSDDSQDDSPTGEWTEIFDWDSNRGEWYAGGKTMEWSFSTPGKKEVWALITDSDGNAEWNHADALVHPGYAIIVAGEGGWKEQWGIDAAADNAYRALQSLGFDDDHIVYLNSRFPRDVDGDGADEVDGYAARSYFEDALQDIRNEIAGCPTPLVLYLTGHGDPVDDTVGFYFGNWVYPDDYIFNWQLSPLLNEFSDETPMLIVLGCCYSGTFITSSNSISAPNRIIVTAAHDGKRNYVGWLQSSDRFFGNLKNGLNVKDAFTARALWGDNHNMWLDDNGDRVGHPPNDLQNDGVLSANTRIGYLSAESLALMPWEYYKLGSPGEIFVHDSMNRITGMVNGELKEEIPNSFYDEESSTVVIFWPSDSYYCHVVGNETETYGLDMVHIEDGTATTFSAVEIGTSPNATHQYIADWSALAQGQQGVTIEVDFNGDGTFEYAFTSDSELTQSEFLDQTAPPPLSVSISPLSAPILVGQSVTFTSTVSGGYTPYGYQWYLNGAPVSGATSNTWAFTPTTGGIYYIHLKVTDAKGNTTQSQTARITAATVPVGGYSIPIERPVTAQPVLPYIALVAALTAVFTKLRPKTRRKR